ncbi:MAG: PGF-pre-PGF domain-containing protein, partial [Methanosarcina sp.]
KTTTIVEMLKNKSTLTPDAPAGEVYNYMNIWVGNGGYGSDEDNLENAVVCFKVEKSWLQEKGIDQSSISLNRYNDKKWNELPTTLLREDNTYLYFTAETPGFSPFAITGNVAAKESGTEIHPETGGSKENTGSTPEDLEQQPGKEDNTSTPEKESNGTGIPGFEMIYGIAGLLTVFLHKRK